MRSLDLFSCIGCHALGFARAGITTAAFCELDPFRRAIIASHFPGVPIHEDVRTFSGVAADIVFGGPPCQRTSVAAAIHGRRDGASLWPHQLRIAQHIRAKWVVVEQPPGNAAWEAEVAGDLCRAGWHSARVEFAAGDLGAPYSRRRVYLLACSSLPRLEVAWASVPSAIDRVKRAADARGDWDAGELTALRVDARASGEMERSASRLRRARIEALGDSNPPGMAEVIGLAIKTAS
jgi:DNA (cytosine-5)-methyltransferase 1